MVGELLKKAREEAGKDLREVSDILKIRYEYLRSIEEEDFSLLPEEVYIKGYIREYAELVHIDPETALRAYVQQTSPPQDDKGETTVKVASKHKKGKISYILVPFVVIAVVFILFLIFHAPEKEPEKAQTPVTTDDLVPTHLINQPEETPQMLVEIKEEDPASLSETKEVASPPHADTLKETLPDTMTHKSPHTLKIVATDTVWLLISTDNAPPQEMTLKLGEVVTFQAQEAFSLKLGNAGGVQVVFDGKDLGKLGGIGQVIKLDLPELL